MKIRIGATRIAFIFKNVTFKFARIRVLMGICWFIKYKLGHVSLSKNQSRRHTLRNFLGIVLSGIKVNLYEYTYSSSHIDDKKVFRTHKTILGLINIQETGNELPENKEDFYKYRDAIGNRQLLKKLDLLNPRQFAVDKKGSIKIVDYGGKYVVAWLSHDYKKHLAH